MPYFPPVYALFLFCLCLITVLFMPYFPPVYALFSSCLCLISFLFMPYFPLVRALFFVKKNQCPQDTDIYMIVACLSRDYCANFLRYTGNSRCCVDEVNFHKHFLPCLSDCAEFFRVHRGNVNRR